MEEQLSSLISQRGYLKGRVTKFESYVKTTRDTLTNTDDTLSTMTRDAFGTFEWRFSRYESLINDFEKIQNQIENIKMDDDELNERDAFEMRYANIFASAKTLLSTTNPNTTNFEQIETYSSISNNANNTIPTQNNGHNDNFNLQKKVNLPKITLPTFSGEYSDWVEFHETFDSLIVKDNSIDAVQKFHYLRSSLSGEASDIIHSIKLTSANFDVAWGLLCEQYQDRELLVQDCIKAIFNLPRISKENSKQIRELYVNMSKHLRSLEILEVPIQTLWDTTMIYILSEKFDDKTLKEWESCDTSHELPTLKDLNSFLKEKCSVLQRVDRNKSKTVQDSIPKRRGTFLASNPSCIFCKGAHTVYNCDSFNKLSVNDRFKQIKNEKRCVNCFRHGHMTKDCYSGGCKKCGARHNTLLHFEREVSKHDREISPPQSLSCVINNPQTILPTAVVHVYDERGVVHNCRIILDSGSQANYVSSNFCKLIGVQTKKLNMCVSGIGKVPSNITSACDIEIKASFNNYRETIPCLVINEICDYLPIEPINIKTLKVPSKLTLADPFFYVPGKVDMLIGVQFFWHLLTVGQIRLGSKRIDLVMQKTKLGWVISGPINVSVKRQTYCNLSIETKIYNQLERFWEIESCPTTDRVIEDQCETSFHENIDRDDQGRFIVALPFKDPDSVRLLGYSREQAERRFLGLERRLSREPLFREQYVQFINEYKNLNHMTKINDDEEKGYYIPHHGVIKEDSTTTKLRVVFDASAKTTTNISLNDLQLNGPTIQTDLFGILLKFRQNTYAICADIEKMYRQVLITPDHRIFQKIVWRENPSDPLDVYQLNTVTYGMTSAPFLAIRCLFQLGVIHETSNPDAARIIKYHFYVDDMLTGFDEINEAIDICNQVRDILKSGCFHLRKWISNCPQIISNICSETISSVVHNIMPNELSKTLGLTWDYNSDEFLYNSQMNDINQVIPTKRIILSIVSQIFDPLGFLSPVTITAKIFLQRLWLEKTSWDEPLSRNLHSAWLIFYNNFSKILEVRIPRHVTCSQPTSLQLHGFSDASERAYGACLYVRSEKNNNIQVHLLCAKTRVAPLKPITIPRLELCAALLLAKLTDQALKSLDLKFNSCTLWTDSTIVLSWINTSPILLKTFVKNRIHEIQTLTNSFEWRHVSTRDNPADYISRGIESSKLQSLHQWWYGPQWLTLESSQWPVSKYEPNTNEINCELKKQTTNFLIVQHSCPINLMRFSNITRTQRAFAYSLRFINNCLNPKSKTTGPLTIVELKHSLNQLVMFVQEESFPLDINELKRNGCLNRKSKILNLNPFLDKNNVLRVGGRLQKTSFNFDKKHPILLPRRHHLNDLLIKHEHYRLGHAGPEQVLYSLREQYWPINARSQVKRICRTCVRCFKTKPQIINPFMGSLPQERLLQNFPFTITGVDYAGPILIRDKVGRGCKTTKAYISLFVCFATRAIHLELVTQLTTEAFLAALKRFIARRGKPKEIYSDNGTNFVGANNKLRELGKFLQINSNQIITNASVENISWKFIPPRSPHFGGLWEAGVKCTKNHLKRVLANATLTFETLYTTLTLIEAILNSRPLSPLSADPNDLQPLTPGHFLIGRPLTAVPDIDMETIQENRLSRFQRAQQLAQHFWSRWSKEFISELQVRRKWLKNTPSFTTGTMVIIKEDNVPPLCWSLGRITKLHPGQDNIVRVVTIKTNKGEIKRSVHSVCVLPFESETKEQ